MSPVKGAAALTMGHLVIPKQAPRSEAWWATAPREGFSAEWRFA